MSAQPKPKRHCRWTHDESHDYWSSGCQQDWWFVDGGPTDNGWKVCPWCTKPIKIVGAKGGEK